MTCEKCGGTDLYVCDSRPAEFGYRRRRECRDCGYKFTTYEISETNYHMLRSSERILNTVKEWLEEYNRIVKDPGYSGKKKT